MSAKHSWFASAVCATMACVAPMQIASAASLTRLDPAGAFQTFQTGSLATVGPRYDMTHNLLGYQSLSNLAWTGNAQEDEIFGTYGVGVDDPTYYPGTNWLAMVTGSTFTSYKLAGENPSGGGEPTSPEPSFGAPIVAGPANHLNMGITQTLYLQAHPQTWKNEPGAEIGGHDNETITLDNYYSVGTKAAASDYLQFRIDPVFNEQTGDLVPVSLQLWTDSLVTHQFGNTGYGAMAQSGGLILHNGTPVALDGEGRAVLNATIGDIISVSLNSSIQLSGSALLKEPTNPIDFNRIMNPVYALSALGFFMDIPVTAGTSEASPLMPGNTPANAGDPFQFTNLVIGSDGPGIDAPLWIDPVATYGYEFEVTGAGVIGIVLPTSQGPASYTVAYYDTALGEFVEVGDNFQGQSFVGFAAPVNRFSITGIDAALGVNPLDPMAFPVGFFFDGPAGDVDISMTPMIIPEPASLGLLALCGAALLRRRCVA